MLSTFKQEIRSFIVNTFLFGQGGGNVSDEDSLLEKGVIDSTGILELVAFLEEKYGTQTADEELIPDNFDSIERLAAFVTRKQG